MSIPGKISVILSLTGTYLVMLFRSNWQVTKEVLTPGFRMNPAIIGIELEIKSDIGIYLLVNLVTMTPDSMVIDISEDRSKLYVHIMYAEDIGNEKNKIKDLEQKLIKILG